MGRCRRNVLRAPCCILKNDLGNDLGPYSMQTLWDVKGNCAALKSRLLVEHARGISGGPGLSCAYPSEKSALCTCGHEKNGAPKQSLLCGLSERAPNFWKTHMTHMCEAEGPMAHNGGSWPRWYHTGAQTTSQHHSFQKLGTLFGSPYKQYHSKHLRVHFEASYL